MGIVMSDLTDQSALCVIGAFLISRSSFEYFFTDREEIRVNATKKMILGAVLFEAGKIITALTPTPTPISNKPVGV